MVKVEVIEDFTLQKFDELKNIIRKKLDAKGSLFIGDIFICTEEMADYLTGNNDLNKKVVKIIEVIPEKEKEEKKPKTPKSKTKEK